MLAENDPIAVGLYRKYKEVRMPNEGLHEVDVATLIEYIEGRTRALRAAEAAGKKDPEK
jgi:protein SCO1/2